jgi:hypothetical protein
LYDETIYNFCARARFPGCTYLRNIILALNTVYGIPAKIGTPGSARTLEAATEKTSAIVGTTATACRKANIRVHSLNHLNYRSFLRSLSVCQNHPANPPPPTPQHRTNLASAGCWILDVSLKFFARSQKAYR